MRRHCDIIFEALYDFRPPFFSVMCRRNMALDVIRPFCIAQSWVSSGTYLTTQFPSHGLCEPAAYGFQTLAKGAAL